MPEPDATSPRLGLFDAEPTDSSASPQNDSENSPQNDNENAPERGQKAQPQSNSKNLTQARRDTGTGAVMEKMVLPALERGGYEYFRQAEVGERLGGGRHLVDVVAYDAEGRGYLISLKWQQTSGTAEQKVPFEAMCLVRAILDEPERYSRAFLVLGGPGWRLREFYTEGGLLPYFKHEDLVSILTLETFVARANRGSL